MSDDANNEVKIDTTEVNTLHVDSTPTEDRVVPRFSSGTPLEASVGIDFNITGDSANNFWVPSSINPPSLGPVTVTGLQPAEPVWTKTEVTYSAPDPDWKYDEGALISELKEYVAKTYSEHYVGHDGAQVMDLIISAGGGTAYTTGNIGKYALRYGKKQGKNRKDLLKAAHYAILALYCHDLENKE